MIQQISAQYSPPGSLRLRRFLPVVLCMLACIQAFAQQDAFTEVTGPAVAVLHGAYKSGGWGDYDNDGDLDLFLVGDTDSFDAVSKLYRNDSGTFTEVNTDLPPVQASSAAWGDYDNDGDLDILLSGYNAGNVSKIYRNDGGVFTDINADLPGISSGSVAWGDCDSDGDLDILLSGSRISKVYRNDGNITFTDMSVNIEGVFEGAASWGDSDNDGDLDILLTGINNYGLAISKVYRNEGSGSFVEAGAGLINTFGGPTAWGDYDNDGDLDILLTGLVNDVGYILKLYRNTSAAANTAPSVPVLGTPVVSGSNVTLNWAASTDVQTPANGLTYNVYVGTSPGGAQKVAPHANLTSGYRRLAEMGNGQQGTSFSLKCLPNGTYYYSVQAVDNAFAGSAFASEGTFTVTEGAPVPTVTAFAPADNAAHVVTTSNLVVTFSENISKGTGNIALRRYSDDVLVETFAVDTSSRVTVSGNIVTINPIVDLDYVDSFYVEIPATAFRNSCSLPYAGTTNKNTWNFVTPASVIYVRSDGIDTNSGGANTPAGAKLTVQSAFNAVDEGGTVIVAEGTYNGMGVNTKNVTLQPSGAVTLQTLVMNGAGKTMTIGDTVGISTRLSLQAGTVASNGNLTLLSTASQTALIDDFSTGHTGNITGNIIAQRFIGSTGTRYVSTPVTGVTAGDFGQYQMASYYNESQVTATATSLDAGWVNIANTTVIDPIKGLSAYYDPALTVNLTGTANTGNFSTTITRTNSGNFTGFNVLGNPYPSPVSWSAIWNLNTNTNVHKTVYVWNNSQNRSALYNFATNTSANGGSNEIAQGQAFRIRVNTIAYSTTFNLDNSVRQNTSSNNFLRKETARTSEKLRLVLSSPTDKEGYETVILSVNNATTGIDAAYDGEFAGDKGMAVIYSKAEGEKMTINVLPELKGERIVALGVEVQAAGIYTISAKEIENFAPATAIYLEDRKFGKLIDLTKEPSYSVQLNQSEANRFFVHFNASARTEGTPPAFVNIYSSSNEVNVQFSEAVASKGSISVVNMLGQVVAEAATEKGQQLASLKLNVPEGVYIVKLSSNSGTISKKVFISAK